MARSLGALFVTVGAKIDGFERSMGTVSQRLGAVDKAAGKMARGFEQVGTRLSNVGMRLSLAITAPLAALGALSVKAFSDFDAAMTESLAIMGDVSDAMKNTMADAAREMAKVSTFSAREVAESYYFLASAGLAVDASIAALPAVTQFAQAGMFDMALATDLLTDAQSALGLTIRDDAVANMENMVHVSDVLVKSAVLTNATVQQFSEALTNKAGPAMRTVNMDIEEGVAVLSAFADQGIKGAEAGTQFGIVLRDLQTKALKNKEAFAEYGVAVFDSQDNLNNMADIIGDLENALDGMGAAQKKATLLQLGFSDKSVAALQAVIGYSESIRGWEKDLRSAGGITKEVADNQLTSFSAQMDLAKSRVVDMAISIGQSLAPAIKRMMELAEPMIVWAEKAVKWFGELDPTTQAVAIGLAATAAAIGPLLFVGGQLLTSIGAISSAFIAAKGAMTLATVGAASLGFALKGLAIGGVLAATYAIYRLVSAFNEYRDAIEDSDESTKTYGDTMQNLKEHLEGRGVDVKELAKAFLRGEHAGKTWHQVLRDVALQLVETEGPLHKAAAATEELTEEQTAARAISEAVAEAEKKHAAAAGTLAEKQAAAAAAVAQAAEAKKWAAKDAENLADEQKWLAEEAEKVDAAFRDQFDTFSEWKRKTDDATLTTEELDAAAEELAESLRRLEQPAYDVQAALDTMSQAQTDAIIAMGEAEFGAARAVKATTDAVREQTTVWSVLGSQISTVFTDLSSSLVDRLFGRGGGGAAEERQRLADEETALKDSLAEREQAWVDFQASVAEQRQDAQEAYRESLDDAEESYQENLKERAEEWEDYQRDTLEGLEDMREATEKSLQKELARLRDSLDDRTLRFERYSQDAQSKIEDITQTHDERQAEEENRLNDSLDKKQLSYDRYAEDVALKITRLREKNDGENSTQEDDLRISLARRLEDLEAYRVDTEEKIAAVVTKHAAAKESEIEAVKLALARRTADYEAYKLDIIAKMEAAKVAHATKLGEQETALTTSLAAQKKKWETYQTDAEAELEAIKAAAKTKLEAQETTLELELADQLADWETHKLAVITKMEELRTAAEGVGTSFKEGFTGALTDIGSAITRFLLEGAFKSLATAIKGLIDDNIPALGKALGKVFGKFGDFGGSGEVGGGGGGGGDPFSGAFQAGWTVGTAIGTKLRGQGDVVGNTYWTSFFLRRQFDHIRAHLPSIDGTLTDINDYQWGKQIDLFNMLSDGLTGISERISDMRTVLAEHILPVMENIRDKFSSLDAATLMLDVSTTRMNTTSIVSILEAIRDTTVPTPEVNVNVQVHGLDRAMADRVSTTIMQRYQTQSAW